MTGPELRALRKKHDLTQRELGIVLGYHANYIARLERGEAPITERCAKVVKMLLLTQKRTKNL